MADEIKGIPEKKVRVLSENQPERLRRPTPIDRQRDDAVILRHDSISIDTRPASQDIRTENAAEALAGEIAERIVKEPTEAMSAHQVHEGMQSLL